MFALMEYKIISGRCEEIRRARMPLDRSGRRVRRGTRAKKSSLRKIMRNESECVKSLSRCLNCNFGAGDLWLTLTFKELDGGWSEAEERFGKFLRKMRSAYTKETGEKLRYVYAPGRRSGDDNARPHYHIVMAACDYEMVCRFWPKECVTYRRLDGRGDYTGVARYMVSNAKGEDGKKKYHPSRGLKKPVYTEPVPVYAGSRIKLPKDADVRERNEIRDDETGFYSAYVRYTRDEKARTRGRKHDDQADKAVARQGKAPGRGD